jgi:hypothetical protein
MNFVKKFVLKSLKKTKSSSILLELKIGPNLFVIIVKMPYNITSSTEVLNKLVF